MTSDNPTPRGNATDIPAMEADAESRMFDALNTTPPRMTLPMFFHSACPRSLRNGLPSLPKLPIVKATARENRKMPIT